jgi:hypothetical protein
MNPEFHSKDLPPAEDRLTDALLAEHARLGRDPDEELISNILLNTVDAPVEISQYVPSVPPRFSMGEWAKVAAAVAAIVSIGAFALSRLGSGDRNPTVAERQEDTFHLVVNYVESPKGDEAEPKIDRKLFVSARPGSTRFVPVAVGSSGKVPSIEIAENELSPPANQFGKSIEDFPDLPNVTSSFRLASNDTTETRDKVIYSGDVVLSHSKFVLKADSLAIDKSGGSGDVPVLKALNATLTHRRGSYETVADAISYNPLSGEIVAKGVMRLCRKGIEQPLINRASTVVFGDEEFFIDDRFVRPF